MNLRLDQGVRAVMNDIIYEQERSATDEKQTTISVMELLEREIERHRVIEQDTRKLEKEIQKNIPTVQKIEIFNLLHPSMNLLEKTWEEYQSKKKHPILITYNDSELKNFSDLEEEEPHFLNKNYDVIKNVMEKAMARGHFYSANLKSISNDFKISLYDDSLFVEFSSNSLNHLNKYMGLVYPYDQNEKWYGKILSTQMGKFCLQTNVSGVYRLLNKSFDIQHFPDEERNSTLRFLQNLQVNQKEIPSFLQTPGTPEKGVQKCKK